MAESAPAAVAQKTVAKKPAKPAEHPKYSEMVQAAIASLKERGGSSRQKILSYIMTNYKVVDEKSVNVHLKIALRNGVKVGSLKQTKGTGATGSFRLGEVVKKAPAMVKKPKNPVTKKPAAKKPKPKKPKTPTKKATKKPATKKTPKKAAKPATKKPAEKKTPKKAAKKTPKKAAKKPVAKKPKAKKTPKKTTSKKPAKQ